MAFGRRVLDQCRLLEMESCFLADARERVLAMPIQAACALPPFDNAAMDGYVALNEPVALAMVDSVPGLARAHSV